MKLYELTGNYRKVSEIEDLDEVTMKDTLDSIQEDIETKIQNIGFVIKEKKADLNAIEETIKSLQKRKTSTEKAINYLQEYSQNAMEATNTNKIKTPVITVWIQDNKESVNITDEEKLDKKYLVEQPFKPDKKLLLADLKEGKEIKGAELQQTRSLRIR